MLDEVVFHCAHEAVPYHGFKYHSESTHLYKQTQLWHLLYDELSRLLLAVWNMYLSVMSEGGGLLFCIMTLTDSSYDLSPSLADAKRLPSNLYALMPIKDRNSALFMSLSVILFAIRKCLRCWCSASIPFSLPNLPNCTATDEESFDWSHPHH